MSTWTLPSRWPFVVLLGLLAIAVSGPWTPGTTRYCGWYVGRPFSGWSFQRDGAEMLTIRSGGETCYVSASREVAFAAIGMPVAGAERVASPHFGFLSLNEGNVYAAADGGSGKVIEFPLDELWHASPSVARNYDSLLYRTADSIGVGLPGLAYQLMLLSALVAFWPTIKRVAMTVCGALRTEDGPSRH